MKQYISIIFFITFLASPSFTQNLIILGNTTTPPLTTPGHTGMLDLISAELFKKVGLKIKIKTLPAERSLVMANEGITDGELVRLSGISTIYPNLIQIPEKMGDIEIVAFAKDIRININGWQSLEPFHVAFLRGWKILEFNITKALSITKTDTPELLFNLLNKGRADIILYHRLTGACLIHDLGLKEIKALEPPLVSQEMFLYLHKKHAAIVPELTAALREMKSDGTYDRIKNQSVGQYLPKIGK